MSRFVNRIEKAQSSVDVPVCPAMPLIKRKRFTRIRLTMVCLMAQQHEDLHDIS